MESDRSQSDELGQDMIPVSGIRVLVVDGDSACLAVVSKILRTLGYEVVTAKLGSDALSIVQDKKIELHLVLMEVHLPDMGRYEIVKKMRQSSTLPLLIMSADARQTSTLEASAEGAEHYFIKPVMVADLRGLWQFARRQGSKNIEVKDIKHQPCLQTWNPSITGAKRKKPELLDKAKEGETIEPLLPKKQKFIWTSDLCKRFMESVRHLGIYAGPKQILEHMNVPGLRNEIVSSFLQRYRLLLKRHEEAVKDPSDLHLGSGLLSQTNNLRRICVYFSEHRGVNHKPDSSSNGQKDLDSSTSMHRPGPSHSPSREIPTGQELISSQNQSILPCNPEGVVVPPKPAIGESLINGNNRKEIAGSSKAENATGQDIFKSDTFFSYLDYTDEENEMLYSILLPVYPLPLEGEEELKILEDEGGDIDDLMDFPKGAEFNDEDLNLWLSTL